MTGLTEERISAQSHRRSRSASILAGLVLAAVVVGPVVAWTQLNNNFDANAAIPGSGYPGVHGQPESCTNQDPWWCLEWPLTSGHSSSVFVFLSASLDQSNNNAGETVNLKQQARNAFGRWNDVPAYSPYLFETELIAGATGAGNPYHCPTRISRGYGLPGGVMAGTTVFSHYDFANSGSRTRIVCFTVVVSKDISFDTDSDPGDGKPDARWMLGHELGHGMGLGHSNKKAIMYPIWPNSKYMGVTPAANDIAGMQAIYGQP